MLAYIKNKNGFTLLGLLLAVAIIAALVYGSSFFWPKNKENKSKYENTKKTVR